MSASSQAVPRLLRAYRSDGTVRGGRVAAIGALAVVLVPVVAYAGTLIQRSGSPEAGGYALLVILLGINLPVLGMLLAILIQQFRHSLPEQPDDPEILDLERRLRDIPACRPMPDQMTRLETDAWAYAHRAPGILGTRAAEVALACARMRRAMRTGATL